MAAAPAATTRHAAVAHRCRWRSSEQPREREHEARTVRKCLHALRQLITRVSELAGVHERHRQAEARICDPRIEIEDLLVMR